MSIQDIRYHIINTVAVILFSYTFAATVNLFFKFGMNPAEFGMAETKRKSVPAVKTNSFEDIKKVIIDESSFFETAQPQTMSGADNPVPVSSLTEFDLLGTISGHSGIARALIRKKSEKEPGIFKLWADVYGYKLVRIDSFRVYLKVGEKVETLDMYAEMQKAQAIAAASKTGIAVKDDDVVKNTQTISRAEIQQKVFSNMDNALKGVRAGPYRENGVIEGYKLFRVQPTNILYQLGARSGDIVKRVNGHAVDSTEKLLKMWQNIQSEGKITIDIDRGGKIHSFDFTISD